MAGDALASSGAPTTAPRIVRVMQQRKPRRQVSPERQRLHTIGTATQALGFLGIVACFMGFALSGASAVSSFGESGNPIAWWIGAFLCMVATGIGAAMRNVATRGVAGSGLVLDPERARTDLEPLARMGGGMLKDALDEAGLANSTGASSPAPAIMVRCRKCAALNAEVAKFCSQCGAEL